MNTPIADFIEEYEKRQAVRLHMPGHKGKGNLGFEAKDITEVNGADVLYCASGIIAQSQQNSAKLFGTHKTLYSTEGSSLAIRAMLFSVCLYAEKNALEPVIFAARNAHKTFVSAAGILGIDVKWLYDKSGNYVSCLISPEVLKNALEGAEKKPSAVYITSPDYLGNISDIKGLSAVCREYGCLLLVDNAHGAYLNFLEENCHPISQGADMCCDSAHKTLNVLTGGAYLHIGPSAPAFFAENAQRAMSTFASTSPSYLILRSLDLENRYLAECYKKDLKMLIERVDRFKQTLLQSGFCLIGSEKVKVTVSSKKYGYTGQDMAEILEKRGIVCEFYDDDFVCLMFTPNISEQDFDRIKDAFLNLEKRPQIKEMAPEIKAPAIKLPLHKAIKRPTEEVDTEQSLGRIAADTFMGCPPAVQIVCAGEEIDEGIQKALQYYKIEKISVLI